MAVSRDFLVVTFKIQGNMSKDYSLKGLKRSVLIRN
jgi:hypothetical protein